MHTRNILTYSIIPVLFTLCALRAYASDATLLLSPIIGTYLVGDSFAISVDVDSGGAEVNAVEGQLEYDPKEFTIESTDQAKSVVTSWIQLPAFDNATGSISFGGSLATAMVLTHANVFSFKVHGKRSGEFRIRFVSGAAIHAADGTGGNIVSTLSNGIYQIVPSVNDPAALPPFTSGVSDVSTGGEVLGAATGTTITSSTHPNQNAWYALATSSLNWDLPSGLSAIRLSLDAKPSGVGSVTYPPTLHEKIVSKIRDGISYFHLTRISQDGTAETSHYTLHVDTTPPANLAATEVTRTDKSDPHVMILVSATDTTSGIDHYEFVLDGSSPVVWVDSGGHRYSVQNTVPGTHHLVVVALDKAGNRSSLILPFMVDSLPTPVITLTSTTWNEADKLKLSAVTVPNATLSISLQKGDSSAVMEEFSVDGAGRGEFESALTLSPGTYRVSAIAHSNAGGTSQKSEDQIIEVSSSLSGVIKRHPLVPVALGGLIVLVVLSWYLLRRGKGGDTLYGGDDRDDNDGNNDNELEAARVPRDKYSSRTPASPAQFAGTVVLEKRKKVEMPSTRL